MPTFRTAPSSSLTTSIRNMIASGGSKLGPVQEMAVDEAAARTAHNVGLAEKARAEVEAMTAAQAQRNDPALRTEYAAHAAGIDLPAATRLSGRSAARWSSRARATSTTPRPWGRKRSRTRWRGRTCSPARSGSSAARSPPRSAT
jgi:hypothetical protein